MAGNADQKLKLLYLMRILLDETDEYHPLSAVRLISRLADYGISAERKSIYSDIALLQNFGLDVVHSEVNPKGYFIGERDFELTELKLLVDAVQSSKFITHKKSRVLIKKLEQLAGVPQAAQLERQVYMVGSAKASNESIYYNVDAIYEAIAQNRQITFQYLDYTLNNKKYYKNGAACYTASPYALIWDDENYYLSAFYEKYGTMSNFRVDKMDGIKITENARLGETEFKNFNPVDYAKKQFSMFGGEEETVKLEFDMSLVGVVIDRFGSDISLHETDDGRFSIRVQVSVSPVFLSWLFQFGDKVRVLSPESVIAKMTEQLERVGCLYLKKDGGA